MELVCETAQGTSEEIDTITGLPLWWDFCEVLVIDVLRYASYISPHPSRLTPCHLSPRGEGILTLVFQLFCLVGSGEDINNLVDRTVHNRIDFV